MDNANFWKNKNVLVTGAFGFVGSHLSNRLSELGANVIVTRMVAKENYLKENPNTRNLRCYIGNVADQKFVLDVCNKESIDTIFHLAASSIVSYAAKEPFNTLSNNLLTTLSILESARLLGIKRTIIASSDKAYGDHVGDVLEPLPYKEGYTMRGLDMYSVSKATGDTIAQAYALQFRMPIAIIRFCNIYGPGDLNFTRLIPRNIFLLLTGKAPTIKSGHENVLREYLFVEDAVRAYLILGQKVEDYCGANEDKIPQRGPQLYGWAAFNCGSYSKGELSNLADCGNISSVTKVIKILRNVVADIEPKIIQQPQQFVEIPDEYLDSSKIIEIGFKGRVGLEEGIKICTVWYKKNYKNIKDIANLQINY